MDEYIKNPQTCLGALRLLTQITTKQHAHVDIIAETKCLTSLLKVLRTTNSEALLGMGIINITLILPVIPSRIPELFSDFFSVIVNAMNLSSISSSLQLQLEWFLQHLYGMFPLSFTARLKEIQKNRPVVLSKLEVILILIV